MKNKKMQLIVKCSMMAALAAVIMLFKVSLPFVPPFYELDLSEVIVMLTGFALGPIAAIITEALKIVINLLLNGTATMGVGEFANFVMGLSFVLPAVIYYHAHKTRKSAAIGMAIGVISLCIVACLMNYFVLLPVYAYFFKMDIAALVDMGRALNGNITNLFTFITIGVLPFNIMKGVISSILVYLTYKKVSPILKK